MPKRDIRKSLKRRRPLKHWEIKKKQKGKKHIKIPKKKQISYFGINFLISDKIKGFFEIL